VKEMFRAGIIGCGRIAGFIDEEHKCLAGYAIRPQNHAAGYQALPNVELVAACDTDEEQLKRFGERWGVKSLYTDHRGMLERERLDVVSVTTRTVSKCEITVDAADSGVKGIIVEKAMATSLEEADRMIEACEKNGVKLVVHHPRRMHPSYREAKRLVGEGAIGKLSSIVGICQTALIHNGTHLFDAMLLFGEKAEWVWAYIPEYTGGDDAGVGYVQFKDDVSGLVDATGKGFEVMLLGSEGRIQLHSYVGQVLFWRYEPMGGTDDPSLERCQRVAPQEFSEPDRSLGSGGIIIRELLDCLETGRESVSSGKDGRAALELGIAFHLSHRSGGKRVELPAKERGLRIINR